jgi:hypothetical protein
MLQSGRNRNEREREFKLLTVSTNESEICKINRQSTF